jgi:hypothetical protein
MPVGAVTGPRYTLVLEPPRWLVTLVTRTLTKAFAP